MTNEITRLQATTEVTLAEYEEARTAARGIWDTWGRHELQAWCDRGGSPESFQQHLKHRLETEPEVRAMANAAFAEQAVEDWLDEKIETAIQQVRRDGGGFYVSDVVAELKRRGDATTTVWLDIMSYQGRHATIDR
jgi:hypothetical protein